MSVFRVIAVFVISGLCLRNPYVIEGGWPGCASSDDPRDTVVSVWDFIAERVCFFVDLLLMWSVRGLSANP